MDFLDLFSSIFFGSSIFWSMGTGSQSGKLLFSQLFFNNNFIIEEFPDSITISNAFTVSSIKNNRVVMGTGYSITGSYAGPTFGSLPGGYYSGGLYFFNYTNSGKSFLSATGQNGIFCANLNHIANYGTTLSPVFVDPYTGDTMLGKSNATKRGQILKSGDSPSMIISGMNNSSLNFSGDGSSIIIGGRNNSIKRGCYSSVIGGFGNKLDNSTIAPGTGYSNSNYKDNCFSAILGGKQNSLEAANYSAIVSGVKNKIYGASSSDNHCILTSIIISGYKNSISSTFSTVSECNAAIVSSNCSTILGCSVASAILNSENSSILGRTKRVQESIRVNSYNLIVTSATSSISSYGCLLCVGQNTIISTTGSEIYESLRSTIIGGFKNCIYQFKPDLNNVYFSNNSIISSICSEISKCEGIILFSNLTASYGNSIISSYKSCISGGFCGGSIKLSTILGGRRNCIKDSQNSIRISNSTILGGYNNEIRDWNLVLTKGNYTCGTIIAGTGSTASSGVVIAGDGGLIENCVFGNNYSSIIGGAGRNRARSYGFSKSSKIINSYTSASKSGIIINSCNVTGDSSTILNSHNSIFCGNYTSVISTSNLVCMTGATSSIIIGGNKNYIKGTTTGTLKTTTKNVFLIGGRSNCITSSSASLSEQKHSYCVYNSGIIGGCCNQIYKTCIFDPLTQNFIQKLSNPTNTVILGGCGLTTSETNTAVFPNLWITDTLSTGSRDKFTASFTYSLEGITGNFTNPTMICFVNGIVIKVCQGL